MKKTLEFIVRINVTVDLPLGIPVDNMFVNLDFEDKQIEITNKIHETFTATVNEYETLDVVIIP